MKCPICGFSYYGTHCPFCSSSNSNDKGFIDTLLFPDVTPGDTKRTKSPWIDEDEDYDLGMDETRDDLLDDIDDDLD